MGKKDLKIIKKILNVYGFSSWVILPDICKVIAYFDTGWRITFRIRIQRFGLNGRIVSLDLLEVLGTK